jgi:hypothetical protein
MKICQLFNQTPQPSSARALGAAGHEVFFLSPADDAPRRLGSPARFLLHHPDGSLPPPADDPSFPAEILHAHDPFLSGEEGLRLAARHDLPLVFTADLHYDNPFPLTPAETARLRLFIEKLGVCFANRCDVVIAPTAALAVRLFEGGVVRPIRVVGPPCAAVEAPAHAGRLSEIYEETLRRRRVRGPVGDTPENSRLREDLVHSWALARPAAATPPHRLGVLTSLRDRRTSPC